MNDYNNKIILNEQEFEYVQQMLDYGSSMEQALMEVRPDLQSTLDKLQSSVVVIQKHT